MLMTNKHYRILTMLIFSACIGCTDEKPSSTSSLQPSTPLQCLRDTECKGDRICENGVCKSPSTLISDTSAVVSPPSVAATEKLTEKRASALINEQVRKTINSINAESRKLDGEDFLPYKLGHKKLLEGDLNGDNLSDLVVELTYCEEGSCNTSTVSTDLLVIAGEPSGKYKSIPIVGIGNGNTTITKSGVIEFTALQYGDDDPTCCPSKEVVSRYKLIGQEIVKVK